MANTSHPNYYNEAHRRGQVQQENWGNVGGVAGLAGGTIAGAHYVGKMPIPTGGYKDYLRNLKDIAKYGGDSVTVTGSGVSSTEGAVRAASGSVTVKGDRIGQVTDATDKLLKGNKASVDDTIKHLDDVAKKAGEAASKEGADDVAKQAAKAAKGQKNLLRAGKWAAAVGAGLAVGAVAKGVFGAAGKAHGTAARPKEEQSWAGREDARRNVTVNLENGR